MKTENIHAEEALMRAQSGHRADLAQVDFFATLPIPKPVTSVGPYDVKVVYRQMPA